MFDLPPPPPPALVRTVQSAEPPQFSRRTNPGPIGDAIERGLQNAKTPQERQKILDRYIRGENWLTPVQTQYFEARIKRLHPAVHAQTRAFLRLSPERWMPQDVLSMDHRNAPAIAVTVEDDLNDDSPGFGVIALTNTATAETARIRLFFHGTDREQNQDTFTRTFEVLRRTAEVMPAFYEQQIAATIQRQQTAIVANPSQVDIIQKSSFLVMMFDRDYIPSIHSPKDAANTATEMATSAGHIVSDYMINMNHSLIKNLEYETIGSDGSITQKGFLLEDVILHEILHLSNEVDIQKFEREIEKYFQEDVPGFTENDAFNLLYLIRDYAKFTMEEKNNAQTYVFLSLCGYGDKVQSPRMSYTATSDNNVDFHSKRDARIKAFQAQELAEMVAEAAKGNARELLTVLVDYDQQYTEAYKLVHLLSDPQQKATAEEELSAFAALYQASITSAASDRTLMRETANAPDVPPEWRQVLEKIGGFYDNRTPALPQVEFSGNTQQSFKFSVNPDANQEAMNAFIGQQLMQNLGLPR
jgi:hypothetical protein